VWGGGGFLKTLDFKNKARCLKGYFGRVMGVPIKKRILKRFDEKIHDWNSENHFGKLRPVQNLKEV